MTSPKHVSKPYYQARTTKKNLSLRSWRVKFRGYTGERTHWLQIVLKLQGTVTKAIFPWILFFSTYSFLIALLEYHELHISLPKIGSGVPNIVLSFNLILSLLLVFRINTAYDRFWEGRKLWGSLVNTSRNLVNGIWVIIEDKALTNHMDKEAALRLVVAFATALKLHLRRELVNKELGTLLHPSNYLKLKDVNNPPLEITIWISKYLQLQYKYNLINIDQLIYLQQFNNNLVDILGGCERILKTPMPLIYSIYLKQLLIVYCLILPVELVSSLNWWTIPVMTLISFVLFGIEETGSELENPFSRDPNDLPLDAICTTILQDVEELIAKVPTIYC